MKPPGFPLRRAFAALAIGLGLAATAADPRPRPANHDEAKVPPFTLPDPLLLENGRRVTQADAWRDLRRPELLRLFEHHVYGRFPPRPQLSRWKVLSEDPHACDGDALRRDVGLELPDPDSEGTWTLALRFTVFLPAKLPRPCPVFVGLHLFDTSKPTPSPAVPQDFARQPPQPNLGAAVGREILRRGYALASLDIGELAPDSPDRHAGGALRLLRTANPSGTGATDTPGALGAWAWGLVRTLDYFASVDDFDPDAVVAIGHSRMGKAALWAGANEPRFAAIIANGSGCGGAAPNRRDFGETVAIITHAFPHWFTPRFATFAGREADLPVDQHELIALLAPRPVYLAGAEQDHWADPRGEYLAAVHASPVYRLLGAEGLPASPEPALDQTVGERLRFHLRRGRHDLTDFDWDRFLAFADHEVIFPRITRRLESSARLDAPAALRAPDAWYASPEALERVNRVLSHQTVLGGWPKNLNTAAQRFEGDIRQVQATFDNGASVAELRFLARFQRLTADLKVRESVRRGVEYVLHAQYPSGGWPQTQPPGDGYTRHITFNDNTMVRLLELMDSVARDPDFEFLGASIHERARRAHALGVACILQCQIRVQGVLTAWCAQHDAVTFEPRPARTFEPISLSGAESAEILRFLMRLPDPSPSIVDAVRAGSEWFARSALQGIRLDRTGGDTRVVPDPTAPPLWARFYDIEKNTPIFAGRDSVIRQTLAEIERERRTGYSWYGPWGAEVARAYARWKASRP